MLSCILGILFKVSDANDNNNRLEQGCATLGHDLSRGCGRIFKDQFF